MLLDAFPRTAPARTLAATVLFRLPGVRHLCLATGCVDAGRPTAQRVLKAGLSLMVLPGGLDEQLETIHGRERVVLKKRFGFVKLAMQHGVPLVPTYVFGSSDLYYTSRLLHGSRKTLAKLFRVALPLYSGCWGLCTYPWPRGFPLPVPQHVVFGDPILVPRRDEPTHAEVEAEHARFVQALTTLFDEHKDRFGAAGRTLEVL
jgi:2-acylglycerol O-acyltransferase 2